MKKIKMVETHKLFIKGVTYRVKDIDAADLIKKGVAEEVETRKMPPVENKAITNSNYENK